MKRVLVINNYDSFVYNLVQLLRESNLCNYTIINCDELDFEILSNYDSILLSPGPGLPSEAGQLMQIIEHCYKTHSILGICLGYQAVAGKFGVNLTNLPLPKHGYQSELVNVSEADPILSNIHHPIKIGRYHSWVLDLESFKKQSSLIATAFDPDGNIMAITHKELPIFGLQFHPESIMCNCGSRIIENWLKI